VWTEVSALVRRPFWHGTAAVSSGAAELAALEQAPGDRSLAVALAEALLARAAADGGFAEVLGAWWVRVSRIRLTAGDVTNTVSGGVQYGPVRQGRNFTGLLRLPAPARRPVKLLGRGPAGEADRRDSRRLGNRARYSCSAWATSAG
jgi:hypothetical protein